MTEELKQRIIKMYETGALTTGRIARILEVGICEANNVIVQWLKK